MLGRIASNLYWMSRYMERAENIARLTEVGHRLSLTPDIGSGYREDWQSTTFSDKTIHFPILCNICQ